MKASEGNRVIFQFLNLHFCTVPQRRLFVNFLSRHKNSIINKTPIAIDWWTQLRLFQPYCICSWRRYLPTRVQQLEHIKFGDLEELVINSDTAKIVGETPENIQAVALSMLQRYAGTYANWRKGANQAPLGKRIITYRHPYTRGRGISPKNMPGKYYGKLK
jgi:hypothetical protein